MGFMGHDVMMDQLSNMCHNGKMTKDDPLSIRSQLEH